MSKAGANNPQAEIEKLFLEIDDTVSIDDIGKALRLSDAKNTLSAIQADLIGMKRMLIQHPKPDTQFQELGGQPIGAAIREKIKQAKRLEEYIKELDELPDDPPIEVEDAKANGHADLQENELPDTLDGAEKEVVETSD